MAETRVRFPLPAPNETHKLQMGLFCFAYAGSDRFKSWFFFFYPPPSRSIIASHGYFSRIFATKNRNFSSTEPFDC